MNIWLISLFDPTPIDNAATGRFIGIAKSAVKRGHSVTHFTSTFRHTTKKQRFDKSVEIEVFDNYKVNYINSIGYKKNMYPKRFYAHWVFGNNLIKEISKKELPDIIFISMPPLSTVDKITRWSKSRNIPVIIDIIDPWPESFIKDVPQTIKPFSKLIISVFYKKLRLSISKAAALSAISKGYIDWALKQAPMDNIMTNYFYPAVNYNSIIEERNELAKLGYEKDKKLRIIYAGSLASSYDIPCICKAAEVLDIKYPGQTQFVIAGTGPQAKIVNYYAERLSNLTYLGWIDRNSLMQQYFLSDLGLIQHKNSLTQTVTYKLFSYLSSGLPVLNSLQSEMVDIINVNKIGLNNLEGDFQKLSENIIWFLNNPNQLSLYKINSLKFTEEKGDADVVYEELTRYIEKVYDNFQISKH